MDTETDWHLMASGPTDGAVKSLADLAQQIVDCHQKATAASDHAAQAKVVSVRYAIRAGLLLREAKKQVPYGEWESWLHQYCRSIKPRTCQLYMRVALKFAMVYQDDPQRVPTLPLRQVLSLMTKKKLPMVLKRTVSRFETLFAEARAMGFEGSKDELLNRYLDSRHRCPACRYEWVGDPRPALHDGVERQWAGAATDRQIVMAWPDEGPDRQTVMEWPDEAPTSNESLPF